MTSVFFIAILVLLNKFTNENFDGEKMNRLSNIKNKTPKTKKKIKLSRLFTLLFIMLLICIIIFLIIFFIKNNFFKNNNTQETIAQDVKYNIKIDGYTSTFSTNEENTKIYKEFKQDQNTPWANKPYWGGTMSLNGCGITSIAIIASGYNINITPEDLRTKYYPHLNAEEMYIALNDLGLICEDFWFTSIYLNEDYILEWLKTNRPILICVDNSKENIWTKASHYMVLLACNENNQVYLSNPNGIENTSNESGWYNINEILPYTTKALFIENYN